jgi:hypothetical protein
MKPLLAALDALRNADNDTPERRLRLFARFSQIGQDLPGPHC